MLIWVRWKIHPASQTHTTLSHSTSRRSTVQTLEFYTVTSIHKNMAEVTEEFDYHRPRMLRKTPAGRLLVSNLNQLHYTVVVIFGEMNLKELADKGVCKYYIKCLFSLLIY